MKEIQLTQGKVALIDDADFDRVMQFKWCAYKAKGHIWYAMRSTSRKNVGGSRLVPMQVELLGCFADHKNGDGLRKNRETQ